MMHLITSKVPRYVTPAALAVLCATGQACSSAVPTDGGVGGTLASSGGATGSGAGPSAMGGGATGGVPSANGGSTLGGSPNLTGGSANGGSPGSTGGRGNGGGPPDPSGGVQNPVGGGPNGAGGSGNGDPDEPLPSAGCGQAGLTAGRASIDVDGLSREYILALPSDYDPSKPYRLIFTWHPWGGSAQQVAGNGANGYYGLLGASDGEAILVSPEGLDFGGNGKGWGNEDGQDIAFLEAMLARFDESLCFDHNRVFSTGFSFGGMMSNAVACSGLARAVAPMAGNSMVSGCANGTKPVAYMGFHGTEDDVVQIPGGRTARDVFIERNGCGAEQPSDSNWCELAGNNYQPCECVTYEGCTEGYPVTWCEFNGPHMTAPNSGQTIWDFFAQF
jgi:polyhydroxybutyrate depolymerase